MRPIWAMVPFCSERVGGSLLVPESYLQKTEKLGQGDASIVYRVKYKNESLAAIMPVDLNLEMNMHFKPLLPFAEFEKQALRNIPLKEAQEIVKAFYTDRPYDYTRIGLKNYDPLEPSGVVRKRVHDLTVVARNLSELIVNFHHMRKFKDLNFQGEPLAPRYYGFIENDQTGLKSGILTEVIAGQSLKKIRLNRAQLLKVKELVLAQLNVIHSHGLVHGDVSMGNVIVDVSKNGDLKVHLIDYTSELIGRKPVSDAREEIEDFTSLIDNLIRFASF